jgi:dTMP kinase
MPDVTFYIDVEPKDGLARTKNRGKSDRLDNEALSFHEKVRNGYLEVAKMYPERIITIDGDGTVDDIYERVLVHLRKML